MNLVYNPGIFSCQLGEEKNYLPIYHPLRWNLKNPLSKHSNFLDFRHETMMKEKGTPKKSTWARNPSNVHTQYAHTQMLHGTGIFTCIYSQFKPNVGKYSSPMEHLGYICFIFIVLSIIPIPTASVTLRKGSTKTLDQKDAGPAKNIWWWIVGSVCLLKFCLWKKQFQLILNICKCHIWKVVSYISTGSRACLWNGYREIWRSFFVSIEPLRIIPVPSYLIVKRGYIFGGSLETQQSHEKKSVSVHLNNQHLWFRESFIMNEIWDQWYFYLASGWCLYSICFCPTLPDLRL